MSQLYYNIVSVTPFWALEDVSFQVFQWQNMCVSVLSLKMTVVPRFIATYIIGKYSIDCKALMFSRISFL